MASTVHITTLLYFTVPLTSLLQTCEKSLILLSFYSSKVGLYSSLPVKPDFTLLGPKVMTFGVKVILFLASGLIGLVTATKGLV